MPDSTRSVVAGTPTTDAPDELLVVAAGKVGRLPIDALSADLVTDGAAKVTMTAAERAKLAGIPEGGGASPSNLDGVPDSAVRLAMTPTERTKLAGIPDGGSAAPADLDGVPDSDDRLAMTPTERTKLTGVAAGAGSAMSDAAILAGTEAVAHEVTAAQLKAAARTWWGGVTILGNPYGDRIARIEADGEDCGALLRQALTAAATGKITTIKLNGASTVALNPAYSATALFVLPDGRDLTIASETSESFVLTHAYTTNSAAYDMFALSGGSGTGRITFENIRLTHQWASQSPKVLYGSSVARGIYIDGARKVKLNAVQLTDQSGIAAHIINTPEITVLDCEARRFSGGGFKLYGRRVVVDNTRAFYGSVRGIEIYIPLGTTNADRAILCAVVKDCQIGWAPGIFVSAPNALVINNRIECPYSYGIYFTADSAVDGGETPPVDLIVKDNIIRNVIAGAQIDFDTSLLWVDAGIAISAHSRVAERITVVDNHVVCSVPALWNGASYGAPTTLGLMLSAADDAQGAYSRAGFQAAWKDPTNAASAGEPIYRRAQALVISTQGAPGYSAIAVRGNQAKDCVQAQTYERGCTLFYNAAGTSWAIPLAFSAWGATAAKQINIAARENGIYYTNARIQLVLLSAAGISGRTIRIEWALSSTATHWATLCWITVASTGTTLNGTISAIPLEARSGPIWIRIGGYNGDGAAAITITRLTLRLLRDGDIADDQSLGLAPALSPASAMPFRELGAMTRSDWDSLPAATRANLAADISDATMRVQQVDTTVGAANVVASLPYAVDLFRTLLVPNHSHPNMNAGPATDVAMDEIQDTPILLSFQDEASVLIEPTADRSGEVDPVRVQCQAWEVLSNRFNNHYMWIVDRQVGRLKPADTSNSLALQLPICPLTPTQRRKTITFLHGQRAGSSALRHGMIAYFDADGITQHYTWATPDSNSGTYVSTHTVCFEGDAWEILWAYMSGLTTAQIQEVPLLTEPPGDYTLAAAGSAASLGSSPDWSHCLIQSAWRGRNADVTALAVLRDSYPPVLPGVTDALGSVRYEFGQALAAAGNSFLAAVIHDLAGDMVVGRYDSSDTGATVDFDVSGIGLRAVSEALVILRQSTSVYASSGYQHGLATAKPTAIGNVRLSQNPVRTGTTVRSHLQVARLPR